MGLKELHAKTACLTVLCGSHSVGSIRWSFLPCIYESSAGVAMGTSLTPQEQLQ